jgi:hypothetical protein
MNFPSQEGSSLPWMEAASDIKNTFLHVSQKVFILFEQAVKAMPS